MKYEANPEHGHEIDATDGMYPSKLTVFRKSGEIGTKEGTVLGYVHAGEFLVTSKDKDAVFQARLRAGAFFAFPGGVTVSAAKPESESHLVLIERFGYHGLLVAGQSESRGRLSYIDGCSDTLLVFPNRLGDCNLNFLHFPPGINQTQHIHPSIRFGVVAGGKGEAWYEGHELRLKDKPQVACSPPWTKELTPGGVFLLEEQEQHSFRTYASHMDVIAYHPDSEWGPTDTKHPMLDRTYINHGKR